MFPEFEIKIISTAKFQQRMISDKTYLHAALTLAQKTFCRMRQILNPQITATIHGSIDSIFQSISPWFKSRSLSFLAKNGS